MLNILRQEFNSRGENSSEKSIYATHVDRENPKCYSKKNYVGNEFYSRASQIPQGT